MYTYMYIHIHLIKYNLIGLHNVTYMYMFSDQGDIWYCITN